MDNGLLTGCWDVSEGNMGFAEGDNVEMRGAGKRCGVALLLNNGAVADPEFLGEMVKVAEGDEWIGIVGSKKEAFKMFYVPKTRRWHKVATSFGCGTIHSKSI